MLTEMIQHVVLDLNNRKERALMEQLISVQLRIQKERLRVKLLELLYLFVVSFIIF